MKELRHWRLEYTARNRRPILIGLMYSDEYPGGVDVYTSPIRSIEGRKVTTNNSTYALDGPSDDPLAGVVPIPLDHPAGNTEWSSRGCGCPGCSETRAAA